MIVRSLVVTAAASLFLVAQAGGQPERRDYAGELREMLKAGLSEAEQQRCVDARAELSAVDAEIKRIDREVLAEFASSTWAQGDHGVPTYVDISLLGDLTGRFARPVDWAIAHEAMRRYEAAGLVERLSVLSFAPRMPFWKDVASSVPVYGVDLSRSLGELRSSAQVLRASAVHRSIRGDECWIHDLAAIFNIGRLLGVERSPAVSVLVSSGMTLLGIYAARELVQYDRLNSSALEQLGTLLDQAVFIPDRTGMIEIDALAMHANLATVIESSDPASRDVWYKQADAIIVEARALHLRFALLTPLQRRRASLILETMYEKHMLPESPINPLIDSAFDLYNVFRLIDRVESESRGVRLAVAVEAYRATLGELPPSLDALAPRFIAAIPTDVYAPDGRFRYQVIPAHASEPASFTIYSVGIDGVDDGGAMPDGEKTSPYDATSGRCTNCDFVIFPMK